MNTPILTVDNYLLYAAEHYKNPQCLSMVEFRKDVNHFILARRLLRRYHNQENINIRLLLNHFIIITNLFSPNAAVRIAFLQFDEYLYPYLFSIFDFLNILPYHIPEVNLKNIQQDTILRLQLENL